MNFNLASIILALIIGIIIGAVAIFIIESMKNASASKKAIKLLEDAKKEADKHKRDVLLEIKEESFRLKQEAEKEIKQKKRRNERLRKSSYAKRK